MIDSMGMRNTIFALSFPGLVSAFGTFLLRQFFMGLPKELEEAAILDGCNIGQIFIRVMLPLVKSGLVALVGLASTIASAYAQPFEQVDFSARAEQQTLETVSMQLQQEMLKDAGLQQKNSVTLQLLDEQPFLEVVHDLQKKGYELEDSVSAFTSKWKSDGVLTTATIYVRNNFHNGLWYTGERITLLDALLSAMHEYGHIVGDGKDEEAKAMLWQMYATEYLKQRTPQLAPLDNTKPHQYSTDERSPVYRREAFREVRELLKTKTPKNAFRALKTQE